MIRHQVDRKLLAAQQHENPPQVVGTPVYNPDQDVSELNSTKPQRHPHGHQTPMRSPLHGIQPQQQPGSPVDSPSSPPQEVESRSQQKPPPCITFDSQEQYSPTKHRAQIVDIDDGGSPPSPPPHPASPDDSLSDTERDSSGSLPSYQFGGRFQSITSTGRTSSQDVIDPRLGHAPVATPKLLVQPPMPSPLSSGPLISPSDLALEILNDDGSDFVVIQPDKPSRKSKPPTYPTDNIGSADAPQRAHRMHTESEQRSNQHKSHHKSKSRCEERKHHHSKHGDRYREKRSESHSHSRRLSVSPTQRLVTTPEVPREDEDEDNVDNSGAYSPTSMQDELDLKKAGRAHVIERNPRASDDRQSTKEAEVEESDAANNSKSVEQVAYMRYKIRTLLESISKSSNPAKPATKVLKYLGGCMSEEEQSATLLELNKKVQERMAELEISPSKSNNGEGEEECEGDADDQSQVTEEESQEHTDSFNTEIEDKDDAVPENLEEGEIMDEEEEDKQKDAVKQAEAIVACAAYSSKRNFYQRVGAGENFQVEDMELVEDSSTTDDGAGGKDFRSPRKRQLGYSTSVLPPQPISPVRQSSAHSALPKKLGSTYGRISKQKLGSGGATRPAEPCSPSPEYIYAPESPPSESALGLASSSSSPKVTVDIDERLRYSLDMDERSPSGRSSAGMIAFPPQSSERPLPLAAAEGFGRSGDSDYRRGLPPAQQRTAADEDTNRSYRMVRTGQFADSLLKDQRSGDHELKPAEERESASGGSAEDYNRLLSEHIRHQQKLRDKEQHHHHEQRQTTNQFGDPHHPDNPRRTTLLVPEAGDPSPHLQHQHLRSEPLTCSTGIPNRYPLSQPPAPASPVHTGRRVTLMPSPGGPPSSSGSHPPPNIYPHGGPSSSGNEGWGQQRGNIHHHATPSGDRMRSPNNPDSRRSFGESMSPPRYRTVQRYGRGSSDEEHGYGKRDGQTSLLADPTSSFQHRQPDAMVAADKISMWDNRAHQQPTNPFTHGDQMSSSVTAMIPPAPDTQHNIRDPGKGVRPRTTLMDVLQQPGISRPVETLNHHSEQSPTRPKYRDLSRRQDQLQPDGYLKEDLNFRQQLPQPLPDWLQRARSLNERGEETMEPLGSQIRGPFDPPPPHINESESGMGMNRGAHSTFRPPLDSLQSRRTFPKRSGILPTTSLAVTGQPPNQPPFSSSTSTSLQDTQRDSDTSDYVKWSSEESTREQHKNSITLLPDNHNSRSPMKQPLIGVEHSRMPGLGSNRPGGPHNFSQRSPPSLLGSGAHGRPRLFTLGDSRGRMGIQRPLLQPPRSGNVFGTRHRFSQHTNFNLSSDGIDTERHCDTSRPRQGTFDDDDDDEDDDDKASYEASDGTTNVSNTQNSTANSIGSTEARQTSQPSLDTSEAGTEMVPQTNTNSPVVQRRSFFSPPVDRNRDLTPEPSADKEEPRNEHDPKMQAEENVSQQISADNSNIDSNRRDRDSKASLETNESPSTTMGSKSSVLDSTEPQDKFRTLESNRGCSVFTSRPLPSDEGASDEDSAPGFGAPPRLAVEASRRGHRGGSVMAQPVRGGRGAAPHFHRRPVSGHEPRPMFRDRGGDPAAGRGRVMMPRPVGREPEIMVSAEELRRREILHAMARGLMVGNEPSNASSRGISGEPTDFGRGGFGSGGFGRAAAILRGAAANNSLFGIHQNNRPRGNQIFRGGMQNTSNNNNNTQMGGRGSLRFNRFW